MTVHEIIADECDSIRRLLIAKNKAYGNSFADPIRIFSKASVKEQINVRIDDKLSRIARGVDLEQVTEDTVLDLIGYLILKRVNDRLHHTVVFADHTVDPESGYRK